MKFEDLLKKDEIDNVQNPDLEFTLGKIESKRSFVNKVVEPVFLFAISGTGGVHTLRCTSGGIHGSSYSSWPCVARDPETGPAFPPARVIPDGVAGSVQ